MKFFKNKLAVTVVVLSVGFLIFIGTTKNSMTVPLFESVIGRGINIFQGITYNIGNNTKNFFGFFINLKSIKDENTKLTEENTQLKSQLMQYSSIMTENENLKSMLRFKDSHSEYSYKGCEIIGKIGSGWAEGFIIDLGSNDGIAAGMVVVTGKGLVGEVTSVASNWAKVLTIINENVQVSGIDQITRDDGIVKGYVNSSGSRVAQLYALPIDSNIQTGDVITTSGKGNFYPKDIVIGEVTSVKEEKGKIQKTAELKPFVDFNKLEEIWVIIPKDLKNITY